MKQLLVDPLVQSSLDDFVSSPVHAVILCGPAGMGKLSLAKYLASQLLQTKSEITDGQFARILEPVKNSISIEQVRLIQDFIKLKVPGDKAIKRVIIISDAHTMTTEAQNAFLKILEEPPKDTVVIMTAVGERSLLPTIYSRCMKLTVGSLSFDAVQTYFSQQGHGDTAVKQAFGLSNGMPGLMSALLDTDSSDPHPLLASITLAKQVLGLNKFDRLCMTDEIAKQKNQPADLLQALLRISRAALGNAQSQGKPADIQKWHGIEQAVYKAQMQLSRNAQSKLLLDNLFISL